MPRFCNLGSMKAKPRPIITAWLFSIHVFNLYMWLYVVYFLFPTAPYGMDFIRLQRSQYGLKFQLYWHILSHPSLSRFLVS